jgi:MFS family permease
MRTRSSLVPWILALGGLDLGLEQFMVVPILPAVQEELGASLHSTAWLLTGYLLAAVATVPALGRLGDLRGKRLVMLACLGAFALGSLVCALAGSVEMLIAGRVVQGFGAALGPLAIGLARDHASPERVAVWVGFLIAGSGAGAALGLLLGGVLVDAGSVSTVFWFLFGLAALLLVAVWRLVPESPGRAPGRIDWVGSLLAAAGLLAALLAVTQANAWGWTSAPVLALFAASAALLAGFVAFERSSPAPLIDVGSLRSRPVWSAVVVAFALGFALLIAAVVIPQLAAVPASTGYGLGLTATETGLALVPGALAIVLGGWLSGVLVRATGARLLAGAGALVAAAGYAVLAPAHDTLAAVVAGNAVLGLGLGIAFTAVMNLTVHAVGPDRTGAFAAATAVSRQAGGALGAQVAAAIVIAAGLGAGGIPADAGFAGAFQLGLVAAVVAAAVAFTIPRRATDPTAMPTIAARGGPALR